MMIKKTILLVISVAWIFTVNAQRKIGSWVDYLSYSNPFKVAMSSNMVFVATTGGLMYYDLEDNSVNKFSSVVELSDFGIQAIAYSEENSVLVIAYENANIDLVYGTQIFNLSDIKRKQMTADKTINNISFIGDEAYLACGFGIVVLNLDKKEIKDTYFIGEGGTSVAVNDVNADNEYIYAATDNGIYKAELNGSNLLDYQNWSLIDNIPNPNKKFNHLINFDGKIIANYTPNEWYNDDMYVLQDNNWYPYLPQIGFVFDLQTQGDYLTITSRDRVFVVDKSEQIIQTIDHYELNNETISSIDPRSAALGMDGSVWVADNDESLIVLRGTNYESISLPGPMDNSIFSLTSSSSALWIAPGGTTAWEEPRFQRYKNDVWTSFKKSTNPELDGFFNIIKIAVDPNDNEHVFVGSWGGGLLEYRNDEFMERYTNLNSPLESALPQSPEEPYVRIPGLDFDSEGNLWIANSEAGKVLHKLSPSGEWESFTLSEIANNKTIGPVLVNRHDDKWILVPRGNDAYVVNKDGSLKRRLLVTSYLPNGETTRMNDVYSIAEDQEGAIWIGTSKGVVVYNNPERIWEEEAFYATQPGLDLNDGIYHPLLSTETVTAIAVDGANRKWLGTNGSGVFLVSENGDKEIEHFTAENSPLLSNVIRSISVNEKSGEVFFGTDKGLISYQGDASGGKNDYSEVYVYPNPVRETYDGPVTITGLIAESDIKITDIGGNLVFKTTSLGGQAVWDGRNLNGRRVKTGVYLVFCNDKYGNETTITKILFIH